MDYRPIIEARYNRTSWQALINDIFGTAATLLQTAAPVEVNNELAREAFYLGRITLPDGYQIAIYEVRLNDHVLVERNRVGIRNLLLSHWRDNGYVGAFMFCYRENDAVLRFSYVSETWQFGDDGNYAKTSTDTKRYTYLLGEGHRSRTAVERFEKLKDSQLTLKDLTKAFSVEALSDKFFDEYKQCYENIVAYVTGKRMVKEGSKWVERTVGTPNTTIMQQFNQFPNAEKAVRDYVKKLMGRLVFIQFLQKKGWMGVPQGDGWENGDREFLQHLYEKSNYKDSFVDNVLEPLFDNINTLRQGDLVTSPNVGQGIKVPYLNGGLFEQDDYDRIDFPLPARFIKSVLDFFAAYNFTIDENDPDDAEVGVDPEMLGRVFENLLEDNKDKGAFYTPKEIVQYMCRESLVAYLQTGITNEPTREAIRQFVTTHDAKHINGADSKLAQQVDRHLKDVKICDPAIGSGAFPMGLLRELYACRQAIEGISPEKAVEIKQHIIQQNIYGVDIEKGAVDIARLRFWLALIVDETTPAALPNLDFKIMQGNSLLEQYRGVDLSRVAAKESNITVVEPERDLWGNIEIKQLEINFQKTDTRKQLQELLEKYFYVSNHCDKQKLRNEIGNIIRAQIKASVDGLRKQCDRQLNELKGGEDCRKEEKKARELLTDKRGQYVEMLKELESIDFVNDQFFLWHTWFADVLNRPSPCNGFDIVIGNPPYVQLKRLVEKKQYDQYYNTYCGNGNIYCLFYELANNLLCLNGIGTFITMNAWYISNYGDKTRRYMLDNASPILVIDLGPDVFINAAVDTSIFIWKRSNYLNKTLWATIYNKPITALIKKDFREVILEGNSLWKDNDETDAIKKHISVITTNIASYGLELYYGILTGANKTFLLNENKKDELIGRDKKNNEIIKPILRGEDIGRYTATFHQQYLLCTHNGVKSKHILPIDINDYPTLIEYFNSFGIKFKNRGEQGKHYWNLRSCQYIKEFEQPKIIYADIVQDKGKFYYDENNFYTNDTAFIICGRPHKLKIILAFLNSNAFSYFYKNFYCGGALGEKGLRYKKDFLLRVPIPMVNEEQGDQLISLVESIMLLKRSDVNCDTSALEAEIDRIVYGLYGLTEEEIRIVEGK